MRYIDIHSHLNLPPLRENQEAVLARMRAAEVATITVGVDYETSKEAVRLAEKNSDVWATVGIHPNDANASFTLSEVEWAKFKKLAKHPKVVAIGETGLDYFRLKIEDLRLKELQKELFKKHIELAIDVGKPLMIHCRNAYEDLYEIVKNKDLKANIHFFQGDVETAKKFLALGFTFSFDGPITFSRDYDEVIKFLPLESIMSETDAPFAAPAPYRGKTNEPAYVVEIAKKIAEIKGHDFEFVRQKMLQNSQKFFNIP